MQKEVEKFVITSDQLKKLRAKKKITQWELADAIGIARNTIGTWEKKDGIVTKYSDILAICKYFNIPLPGTEEPAPAQWHHINEDETAYNEENSTIAGLKNSVKKFGAKLFGDDSIELTEEITRALLEIQQSVNRMEEKLKQSNTKKE
jgi:DNA-binding XRE family transcriptional regulator